MSPFLPSGGGLIALEEVAVDFSGKVLSSTAQLSVGVSGGVTPDATILVAEVVRVDDIPRLMVVALARVVVDRIVSKPVRGKGSLERAGAAEDRGERRVSWDSISIAREWLRGWRGRVA